jgi:hypothetical protein
MLSENPYQAPIHDRDDDGQLTVAPTRRELGLAVAASLWIAYLILSAWLQALP